MIISVMKLFRLLIQYLTRFYNIRKISESGFSVSSKIYEWKDVLLMKPGVIFICMNMMKASFCEREDSFLSV